MVTADTDSCFKPSIQTTLIWLRFRFEIFNSRPVISAIFHFNAGLEVVILAR
jgi:hypothetical protein